MVLLGLLSLHAIAAPVAACVQPHENHSSAGGAHAGHEAATAAHEHGHAPAGIDAASSTSDDAGQAEPAQGMDTMPMDCLAFAACGAPAVVTVMAAPPLVPLGPLGPAVSVVAQQPAAIVLGLLTPPPKI